MYPNHWYEWITGEWSLHFIHALCEKIEEGEMDASEIAKGISEATEAIPKASTIAEAVALGIISSAAEIKLMDLGNGVKIQFLEYIMFNLVLLPSDFDWN
ncbi:hypothetical protein [Spiroplasma endosymbiont of Aspidapion aeneum]|uniref:hypothetical protein n=1 Tax=Spiroplasma endosymbiont of Aspidapion aeneum TaxID=3066276 RepID=UPI00313DE9A8